MKVTCCALLRLSLAIGIGTFSLNAATTVPVGAVNVPISAGLSVLNIPFQKPVEFQGTVSGVSGAEITLSGSIPALTGPHYLQVISGVDAGRIYTVDSYVDNTVTLIASPTGLAADDVVALRAHMTLGDLSLPSGATLILLNGLSSPTIAYSIPSGWTQPVDTVIQPGEAVIVNSSVATDLLLYGTVSVDDVIIETNGGLSAIGSLDPVYGSELVLDNLINGGLDAGTVLIELVPGSSPINYTKIPTGWIPDPSTIDVTDYKSFLLSSSLPLDIVLEGNTVN